MPVQRLDLTQGTREPWKAVGGQVACSDSGLVSVTISLREPELVTSIRASVSLYVKGAVRSSKHLATQMPVPFLGFG